MEYDYLLVGQGIAGTLMAFELLQKDKKILVIDAGHPATSSKVAAGIINPITGRHFVKSWHIDALLPKAWASYRALEQLLGITILEERPLTRFLATTKAHNDWLVRSGNPELQTYLGPTFDPEDYRPFLQHFESGVVLQHTGRARLAALTSAFKDYLRQADALLEAPFDYKQLHLHTEGVQYQSIQASKLIFAEGHRLLHNPYFNYLPLTPAKGDVLIVRIPDYPASQQLIKHGVFIVPLTEPDHYWVGSTYHHHYQDSTPLPEDRLRLEERLAHALRLPFEVVEHRAAIRPAVRDRRPLLGQHPEHSALYLLNGLGAKGASLGPHCAQALLGLMERQQPLQPEVDLHRFERFYPRDAASAQSC